MTRRATAARTVAVTVRLTRAERATVRREARDAGMTVSTWLRARVLGVRRTIREEPPDDARQLRIPGA
jgi:hypothetical protein